MFVIVVYDMEADRTDKPRKLLRQYLTHMQNSVFEGHITEGDLNTIKPILENMPKDNESIIIYEISSENYIERTAVGEDPRDENQFV